MKEYLRNELIRAVSIFICYPLAIYLIHKLGYPLAKSYPLVDPLVDVPVDRHNHRYHYADAPPTGRACCIFYVRKFQAVVNMSAARDRLILFTKRMAANAVDGPLSRPAVFTTIMRTGKKVRQHHAMARRYSVPRPNLFTACQKPARLTPPTRRRV